MMILNRVPLLKPKPKKPIYQLWWHGGVAHIGSLEEMGSLMEGYIDYFSRDYYCVDWEKNKRALLRNRSNLNLEWLFEIKEKK